MPDLLATADAWLAEQLQEHASQSVTYSRLILGVTQSVTLDATVGRSLIDATSSDGFNETFETRDYLFPTADLVLAGAQVLPAPGDLIVEGENTYKVTSPGGAKCYRFTDAAREQLRIHTIKTA